MNLFGIGPVELGVVLLIILVLFGPERLPEIAKRIGGTSREIRDNLNSINTQMNSALELSMEEEKNRMLPPRSAVPPTVTTTPPSPVESPSTDAAAVTPPPPTENEPPGSA